MDICLKIKAAIVLLLSLMPFKVMASFQPYQPTFWDASFYTFAFTGLVFAAFTILAYNEKKWLTYVGFALLMVINAASMDGFLALLVGRSDFVTVVLPFLLYTVTASFGYWVIAIRLEPPHVLAKLKSLFFVLSTAAGLLALSTPVWLGAIPIKTMWAAANLLFFGMVMGHVLPPLTWIAYSQKLRLFIRVFPFVASSFAVGGFLMYSSSPEFSERNLHNLYRWTLLIFAFFAITIVVWQVFGQRKLKEAAESVALEAARQEAEAKLNLIEADKAYQEAVKVAHNHQKQLATVSHDLKQPISAMRIAADQLRKNGAKDADKLSKAVDYIDSLAKSYLTAEETKTQTHAEGMEEVSTHLLGQALQQMFESEAQQNGIRFKLIAMDHLIYVEPLSLMRIMTNVISNAIVHSRASKILVGFRKRLDRVVFQIHDNGCGIDVSDKENIFVLGEKGEHSAGQGLGLGIVQELCQLHGFPIRLETSVEQGTSIYIELPLAQERQKR